MLVYGRLNVFTQPLNFSANVVATIKCTTQSAKLVYYTFPLKLFSRVIIKRIILQNSLHIKLDYHYVYLVKDFFLLRLELFLYSQSCCGRITGLLLQRYDRLQAVRLNPWLFFLQLRIIFVSELDINKQKMKHTLRAT